MANQLETKPVEYPHWKLYKELPGNNPPIPMRLHLMANSHQSLGYIEQASAVHTYQVVWELHVLRNYELGLPSVQTFTSLEEAMGVLRVLSPRLMELI